MNSRRLIVFILCELSLSTASVDDPTLVSLPDGQIRGHILRSQNNNVFYAFQEIPYAAPPVGELRFKPPVPPKKWSGVLDATKNTKVCYQSNDEFPVPNATQTEDCLYLNVYTPQKPRDCSKPPLPVLVWIHGGGLEFGAGVIQLYKPKYFMDYDVVVVTINYRLAALGFLTTEDGVIPGNLGMKDHVLALQWVKKNINLFGGDPNKITIAGESSGAANVGLLVISPKTRGLFRAAILQSGTALAQWSHQEHARYYAFELGRSLDPNFSSNDSKELLKLLKTAPAAKIVKNNITTAVGKETSLFAGEGLIWLPVIEHANLEGTFLTSPFHEDVRTGNINQVPILIGFNSEETLFHMAFNRSLPKIRAKYFDNDLSNLIRGKYKMTQENKVTAGRRLRRLYTDGTFQDNLGAVIEFYSDDIFTSPTVRHAKLQSNYTDVYLYEFSYKGKMGGLKDVEVEGVRGVGHAEDLGYFWDLPVTSDGSPDDPEDVVIRQRVLTLWANFVKYLNPTPKKDSLLCNVSWKKLTPNNLVYLNINNTLKMERNPRHYLQWEEIVDSYSIPPLINY